VGLVLTPEDVDDPHLDPKPPLEVDWAARAEDCVFHMEAQSWPRTNVPARTVRYNLGLTVRYWPLPVHTIVLWHAVPPAPQRSKYFTHGDVRLRVHHIVLPWQDPDPLLAVPEIACFASGALAGKLGEQKLCDLVAAALARSPTEARKIVAAAFAWRAGRYEIMIKSMEKQRVPPPVMIEEFFLAGLEKGEAKGKAEGKAEGELHGKAAALLTLLEARGFSVDDALRSRIESCTDGAQLDRWIARAARAQTLADVLS